MSVSCTSVKGDAMRQQPLRTLSLERILYESPISGTWTKKWSFLSFFLSFFLRNSHFSLSVSVSLSLPLCLSVCLSVCLSICLSCKGSRSCNASLQQLFTPSAQQNLLSSAVATSKLCTAWWTGEFDALRQMHVRHGRFNLQLRSCCRLARRVISFINRVATPGGVFKAAHRNSLSPRAFCGNGLQKTYMFPGASKRLLVTRCCRGEATAAVIFNQLVQKEQETKSQEA